MELLGMVRNGVIVLDAPAALPEGTRVRIAPATETPSGLVETTKSFADYFDDLHGAAEGLPADFAEQIDHYRLGTPKR